MRKSNENNFLTYWKEKILQKNFGSIIDDVITEVWRPRKHLELEKHYKILTTKWILETIGKDRLSLAEHAMIIRNSLLRAVMEQNEMEKYINTHGKTKN